MSQTTPEAAKQFKFDVLRQFYIAIHSQVNDNFAAGRFNFDGVDHSTEFLLNDHCFFLDWFFANGAAIHEACSHLNDDESRAIYKDLLIYRLVGHLHYKVRSAVFRTKKNCAKLRSVAVAQPSQFPTSGMFGQLQHFDFEWEGKRYVIDCMKSGLMPTLGVGQYFLQREGISVQPSEGDHVVDGGACLGDTALVFSNAIGPTGKVYAFDPVEDNLLICLENETRFPHRNVKIFPTGLSDKNVNAPPIRLNHYAPGFSSSNADSQKLLIPLRTLDSMVELGEIERVDFIKLDVEGAEMETLRGARSVIEIFRPRMAISIYHKPDDFFQIINYIRVFHPYYALYLDHYTIHREETVLYCLPQAVN